MIKTTDGVTTITCDKCGALESEKEKHAGRVFFDAGWSMNQNAKKYVHLCYHCKTAKQRRAHEFVRNKFAK